MGDILDNLGSMWNNLEHTGEAVFHSIDEVISHLSILGVPSFASLEQFIHFLISEGENPFTFLPKVVGEINSRGGSAVEVLEELASDFILLGPIRATQNLYNKKVAPLLNGLNQYTQTSHTVASVHQDTITQVQQKLTTLRQGTNGSMALQGDFATALDTHFATIHSNVTQLTTPLASSSDASTGDPWAQFLDSIGKANHELLLAIEQVPQWKIILCGVLDLAIVFVALTVNVVVAVPTGGAALVPLIPIDGVLVIAIILLDVAILGLFEPFLKWLVQIIAAVIALGIQEFTYHTQAHSTAIPYPQWVLPDGQPLPKAREARARALWDQYRGTIGKALTASIIAYLSLYCSVSVAQDLLDNWALFGPVLTQLNNDELGDVLSAEALINAIVRIGPLNVKTLGFPYPWTNPDGSPVRNNGRIVQGDIDIVTKYNPPWYVEVGPYTKGDDPAHFVRQLTQLKRYADNQNPPATAKFYMQMPSVPMTANQATSMGETLTIARRILDGQNISTTVDPTTGEIIPPLTTQNVVVMGRPESNCPTN